MILNIFNIFIINFIIFHRLGVVLFFFNVISLEFLFYSICTRDNDILVLDSHLLLSPPFQLSL